MDELSEQLAPHAEAARALARLVLERGAAQAARLLRTLAPVLRAARAALLERAREAWQRTPPLALALFRARAVAAALRDSAELDGRRARRALAPLYAIFADALRLLETGLSAASDLAAVSVRVGRAEGGAALAALALDASRLLAADALALARGEVDPEHAPYEPWRPHPPSSARSGGGSVARRDAAADDGRAPRTGASPETPPRGNAQGRFAAMFELADPPCALSALLAAPALTSASRSALSGVEAGSAGGAQPSAFPPPPEFSPPPPPPVGVVAAEHVGSPATAPAALPAAEEQLRALDAGADACARNSERAAEQPRGGGDVCRTGSPPASRALMGVGSPVSGARQPLASVTLQRGGARTPLRGL